jgi:hypothetical protein
LAEGRERIRLKRLEEYGPEVEEPTESARSEINMVDLKRLNKEIKDAKRRRDRYKSDKPADLKINWAMQSNHNLIYCLICSIFWVVLLSVGYIIFGHYLIAIIKGEEEV